MTVDVPSEAEAANELMRLAKQIARHDRLYHAEDAPEITDQEYDALVRRNAELEAQFPHLVRPDSPSRAVGHAVAASPLSKVTHEVRMMSLDNAFADEEVADFVARVRRFLALGEDEPVAFTAANPQASHFDILTPGADAYRANEPAMLKVLRGWNPAGETL